MDPYSVSHSRLDELLPVPRQLSYAERSDYWDNTMHPVVCSSQISFSPPHMWQPRARDVQRKAGQRAPNQQTKSLAFVPTPLFIKERHGMRVLMTLLSHVLSLSVSSLSNEKATRKHFAPITSVQESFLAQAECRQCHMKGSEIHLNTSGCLVPTENVELTQFVPNQSQLERPPL